MTALRRGLAPPRPSAGAPAAIGAAAGAAVAVGAAVGMGYGFEALLVGILAVCLLVALADWRWSIYAVLVYLPFSGIPSILTYPDTGLAVLAKDILFLYPAYLGFIAARGLRGRPMGVPRAPLLLIGLFSLLVAAQALVPAYDGLLSAIGVKVYLSYIPLLFLGYHLVDDAGQVRRLLGVLVAAAIIPAAVGVIEAVLIYTGFEEVVYRFYGAAAEEATKGYEILDVEGAQLRRVPSTFGSVTEFYVFLGAMVAVAYAWWRSATAGSLAARYGGAVLTLMTVAAFTCGARGAFVFVPILLGLMLLLDRGGRRISLWLPAALGIALIVTLELLGAEAGALFRHVYDRAYTSALATFPEEMGKALDLTLTGLGPGIDSSPGRYALPAGDPYGAVGGLRLESYWAKSLVELGVVGLVMVLALLGRLLQVCHAAHSRVRDSGLLPVSAALLALLVWSVLYNIKASYLDTDPLNVYFWLFAGLLLKLPALVKHGEAEDQELSSPHR